MGLNFNLNFLADGLKLLAKEVLLLSKAAGIAHDTVAKTAAKHVLEFFGEPDPTMDKTPPTENP